VASSDSDYGVPIPGRILPPDQWARTAIKRLPPPGPLDWTAIFGREAPLVLDLGCGNGRFVIASALARPELNHVGIEVLPVVIRYATRRANQRGLSNVRLAVIGDSIAADTAIAALERIRQKLTQAGERYWSEQVEIQRRSAMAWRAFGAGRTDLALTAMRAAAEQEDATEKNAITPGPLAPARELLGEMLLAAHQPAPALAEFQATLRNEPNRFRALAGAVRAANESGDRVAARKYSAELRKLAARGDRPLRE